MLRAWKVLGPGCEFLRPFLGAGIRNRFEKPAKEGLRIGPAPEQTFPSALHVSCGEHCYVTNFSYLPSVKLAFSPLLPHLNPSQTQDSAALPCPPPAGRALAGISAPSHVLLEAISNISRALRQDASYKRPGLSRDASFE